MESPKIIDSIQTDTLPSFVISHDSDKSEEDSSQVTDTSEEDSAQVLTLKVTPSQSSEEEDMVDFSEGNTQSLKSKKTRKAKASSDHLVSLSVREVIRKRASSRNLKMEETTTTTTSSILSVLTVGTAPTVTVSPPVKRAHDILLLSGLLLGAPDWETWANCSPLQMWNYIPLFLRVFHRKEISEKFFTAIKPLFHHPLDESIRHLIFWMSRCDMLPSESASFFGNPDKDQEETHRFFESLGTKKLKANDTFLFNNVTMCDPVFGVPSPLAELTVVKLFKAHTRPALCDIRYKDPVHPNRRFIYKKGDDLRDDMYTQVMFFVFNKIWENSGIPIKPFIHMYRVFPTGSDTGFVEFVPSTTIQAYDWNNLDGFSDDMKKEFICSAAGAFAGAFILGIRDRHRDNMMISDKGHFFHIDFGYMFNNRTWFDANRFAIPTEIRTKLPQMWDCFLELIGEAYRLLRRNRGMITYFVTKLFGGMSKPQGVKKFKEPQIIKCLTGAFYDQLLEQEAVAHIRDLASKGEASPKKALKDLVHNFESKQKK